MRAATLRTLERVADAPPPVDRERARAKVAAEVVRCDAAFEACANDDTKDARKQARGVLRAMDADSLTEQDWRDISEAYSNVS